MKTSKFRVSIFSDNPDRLKEFYTNVLMFKETVKVDRPEEYGYGIEVAKGYKIWIAKHSKVKGKSNDKFRIMLSFYVDDIKGFFDKVIKESKVKIIESPILACVGIKGEERIICSFLDPDSNLIQMVQLTGN